MSSLSVLAKSHHNNHQRIPQDNGWRPHWTGSHILFLNEAGHLVDPQRQIIHPSFREVRDQGVFYYDFNPDTTLNFIYGPAQKVDTGVTRTVDSSVAIQVPTIDEDVIITETWEGSPGRSLSTLASMYRTLRDYWTTIPDPGDSIRWWPADITTDRYDVQITALSLGGANINDAEIVDRLGKILGRM